MSTLKPDDDRVRQAAENDLAVFIQLIHPNRVLGHIHLRIIRWWTRQEAKSHQLLLLPRDHQKSALLAYRVAWEITKNPALRVLYISSTSNLAVKQLKFIKDILTSAKYRKYWPDMVYPEEAKREKWSETEISVDHPLRRAENIREPTIFTAGLTTNITGLHCDIMALDDVVVNENAYTEEGRRKTREQYSFFASVESTDAKEWVVGTRYHPKDLYSDLVAMEVPIWDKQGDQIDIDTLFEKMEEQVEDAGDGSGQYLWPRQQRHDGKWFGFNQQELEKKRAQYLNKIQFKAQYYNNPNDFSEATIKQDYFQYYDKGKLNRYDGRWTYNGNRLNVFAAVDFAFSLRKEADYSAIVVVGIDASSNYYILDIDRFKTQEYSEYFKHILKLLQKWDFKKLRAEVTVAQQALVTSLKNDYIKKHGLVLSIDEFRPSSKQGTKEERIEAVLQPRYQNRQIWHYEGGNCQVLEEELLYTNPAHDDVKDALAACVDICVPPMAQMQYRRDTNFKMKNYINTRFGGIN